MLSNDCWRVVVRNLSLVMLVLLLMPVAASAATDDENYQKGFDAYLGDDMFGAMRLLDLAAQNDHVKAIRLLAYINDKAEENETAVRLYKRGAALGDEHSALALYILHKIGEAPEIDETDALEYLKFAADKELPEAMHRLAEVYGKGEMGTTVDNRKALRLLSMAAKARHEPALRSLSDAYSRGEYGLRIDASRAAVWARKADEIRQESIDKSDAEKVSKRNKSSESK